MDISDITEQQIIDLIEVDNQDLVDFGYPNYKFNIKTNKVYSLNKNKYLTQQLTPNGSYRFTLYKNKLRHYCLLHRIVFSAHNPTIDISFSQIIHINNDTTNNNIDNLKAIITDKNDLIDIPDYPDYKLNKNNNKVYSTFYNSYSLQHLDKDGYYIVALTNNKKQKNHRIHRIIFKCHNPTINIEKNIIDHIDRNRTNNNIDNLRIATHSQSQQNRTTPINNTSGYKNIRERKNCKSFEVAIRTKKIKYTKSFGTLEEAIIHRDIKLLEIHKEFANSGK